jgi:hypothetical protein
MENINQKGEIKPGINGTRITIQELTILPEFTPGDKGYESIVSYPTPESKHKFDLMNLVLDVKSGKRTYEEYCKLSLELIFKSGSLYRDISLRPIEEEKEKIKSAEDFEYTYAYFKKIAFVVTETGLTSKQDTDKLIAIYLLILENEIEEVKSKVTEELIKYRKDAGASLIEKYFENKKRKVSSQSSPEVIQFNPKYNNLKNPQSQLDFLNSFISDSNDKDIISILFAEPQVLNSVIKKLSEIYGDDFIGNFEYVKTTKPNKMRAKKSSDGKVHSPDRFQIPEDKVIDLFISEKINGITIRELILDANNKIEQDNPLLKFPILKHKQQILSELNPESLRDFIIKFRDSRFQKQIANKENTRYLILIALEQIMNDLWE